MSEKNNGLELYMLDLIKEIDSEARLSKASGACGDAGDIRNRYLALECKEKTTKENIILDYRKEWLKLLGELPVNSKKIPVVSIMNKLHERFVILKAEDFIKIMKEAIYAK